MVVLSAGSTLAPPRTYSGADPKSHCQPKERFLWQGDGQEHSYRDYAYSKPILRIVYVHPSSDDSHSLLLTPLKELPLAHLAISYPLIHIAHTYSHKSQP